MELPASDRVDVPETNITHISQHVDLSHQINLNQVYFNNQNITPCWKDDQQCPFDVCAEFKADIIVKISWWRMESIME